MNKAVCSGQEGNATIAWLAHKKGKVNDIGILAAAGDASLNGNVSECCDYYDIVLGANGATYNLMVSGNLIHDCLYGVGASRDATSGTMMKTSML